MIPSLSQETITEYASEAQTIQEPTGTDYTQGVRVGKTVPAKWWNWLFKGATRRLGQAKTDAQSMLTELQNVVTDAGITLDGSNNTQLAQAVAADADTQIDKYVTNKKGFMTLWGAQSMPPNLSEYTQVRLMFKVGDLCFIVCTDTSKYKVCVALSSDMVTWRVAYTVTLSNSSLYRCICDCRYFNGAYYLLTDFNCALKVFKSTDTVQWTEIHTAATWGIADHWQGIFFDVTFGSLYLGYVYAYDSTIRKLNDAGDAFNTTGMIMRASSGWPRPVIAASLCVRAVPVSSTLCIVGRYLMSSNEVLTETQGLSDPGIGAFQEDMQLYGSVGTNALKLINGNVVLLESEYQNGGYTGNTEYWLYDSSGALVSSWVTEALHRYTLYTNPMLPTYVFCRLTQFGETLLCFSDTSDPFYGTSLPFNDPYVTQIGEMFYVACSEDTMHTSIYRIANALSANISDYTLVGTINHVSAGKVSSIRFAGIENALYLTQGTSYWVSTDGGANWKQSKTINNEPFCDFVRAEIGGAAYTLPSAAPNLCNKSEDAVNRVVNHTLYLR